jgi:DNA-binding protein YbaB
MIDPVPMTDTDVRTSGAQQALVDLVAVEESWDGLVRVSVGAFGDLRELHLDPRTARDAAALAADVMHTVRTAAAGAAESAQRLVPDLMPGTTTHDVDLAFDPVLYQLDRRTSAHIDYAAFRRYVTALRDRTRDLVETADSDDGLITATVSGRGTLLDLTLDPRALRDRDTNELAADILATVRRATAQLGDQMTAISRRLA